MTPSLLSRYSDGGCSPFLHNLKKLCDVHKSSDEVTAVPDLDASTGLPFTCITGEDLLFKMISSAF
jgi:hypothetical protein